MKKIKALCLTALVSVNANADILYDIGDWIEQNKTLTAVIGVGIAAGAAATIKPISMLLEGSEKELIATEKLAGQVEVNTAEFEGVASRLKEGENELMVIGSPATQAEIDSMAASLSKMSDSLTAAEEKVNASLAKAQENAIRMNKQLDKAAELTRKDAFRVETQAEKELRRQKLIAEAERLDKEVKLGEKQAEQAARDAMLKAREDSIVVDNEGRTVADRLDSMDNLKPMKGQTPENMGTPPKGFKIPVSGQIPVNEDILKALKGLQEEEGAVGGAVGGRGADFSLSSNSSESSLYSMEWGDGTNEMILAMKEEGMGDAEIVDYLAHNGGNFYNDITEVDRINATSGA